MTKGAKRRVDPLTKKLRKAELVSFLTSKGGIKEGLANSIYEQGLDRWSKLVNGDETYFLSFRGVGLKTAAMLLELSREKKKEFETNEERSRRLSEVRALLRGVPRMRATAVNDAIRAGFDSVGSLSTADPEELRKVKGVGPKLALSIIEQAKEALAVEPAEPEVEAAAEPMVPPVIEEATGLMAEEAPKEVPEPKVPGEQKGFFDRFLDGLKRFFSPAKEAPPKESEAPTEPPAPVLEGPKEGEAQVKVEEAVGPEPDKSPVTLEPIPEDAPSEPAAQPVPEGPPEPPKVESRPEAPKVEPPLAGEKAAEKAPSFFQKLKGMLLGSPKEAAPEPPKTEAKPEEGPQQPDEVQPKVTEEPAAGSAPAGLKNFEDIPGVDGAMAQKLRDSGYLDIEELKEAIPEDLMMIEGISKEVAEAICSNLKPSA